MLFCCLSFQICSAQLSTVFAWVHWASFFSLTSMHCLTLLPCPCGREAARFMFAFVIERTWVPARAHTLACLQDMCVCKCVSALLFSVCEWEIAVFLSPREDFFSENPPHNSLHLFWQQWWWRQRQQRRRWQQQQQQADYHEKGASVGLMGGTALWGDKW